MTTWCGQLSIATSTDPPGLAAGRLDPCPVGRDGDQRGRRAPCPRPPAARRPRRGRRAGLRAPGRSGTPRPPPGRGTRRCCGRRPRRAGAPAASAAGTSAHCDERTTLTAVSDVPEPRSSSSVASPKSSSLGQVLWPRSQRDPVGRVETRADLGEVRAEVGEHPRVLRPLAREEEREPPRSRRAARPRNTSPSRRGSTGRPGRRAGRSSGPQPVAQVGGRLDDQADAERERRLARVERVGQVLERDARVLARVEPVEQRLGQLDPARAVGARRGGSPRSPSRACSRASRRRPRRRALPGPRGR